MKKTVTLLAVGAISAAAAASAQAASSFNIEATTAALYVCEGATNKPVLGGTGAQTSGSPITVTGGFIKVAFSVTCSANTWAAVHNYSASSVAVGSTSTKGNQSFRGGANSGGIVLSAGCAATGCSSTDASTAVNLAVTNGS